MSGTVAKARPRLRDRRPAPVLDRAWLDPLLMVPGGRLGGGWEEQLRWYWSRGLVPEMKAGPVPLWLRHPWGGWTFLSVTMAFTVTALVSKGIDVGSDLFIWFAAIAAPVVTVAVGQSLFRSWWTRADLVERLNSHSRWQEADRARFESEPVLLWRRAVKAAMRVRDVTEDGREEQLYPHLAELYPLICRAYDILAVGQANLAGMPAQKAEYDQLMSNAGHLVGKLLADVDVILALNAQSRPRLGWRPDGEQLPEHTFDPEEELR